MARKRSKRHKLEAAVARINARLGRQAVTRGRPPVLLDTSPTGRSPASRLPTSRSPTGRSGAVTHISTGFADLDNALCMGGLPKGKISEIVGLPTSGKTTLALKFLAQAQAGGAQVAYVDQARFFDADYAHRCGVDLSRLIVGKPYGLTEALATTEALVRNGSLAALVFDVMDGLWDDPHTVPQLASCLSRLLAPLARSSIVLLFLHTAIQARSTPLAHYATVRLRVAREQWLECHGDVRGYEAQVDILKNRLGPSGHKVTIAIEFNGTVRGDGL
jgi:recombination protein RecA